MLTAAKAADWLKTHSAHEKSFGRALRQFFSEQADRIAATVEREPNIPLPLLFNFHNEQERLTPIARRNVGAIMVQGALNALAPFQKSVKVIDLFDSEVMEAFDLSAGDVARLFHESLPEPVRQAIQQAVNEVMRQDYWVDIQVSVSKDLGEIIKDSIANGDSGAMLAKRIRTELGGDNARTRAKAIARTETTMSLNAGHQTALESIAADIKGKEWLAIGDQDTRQTHLELNGSIVAVKDEFSVGGFSAPFPGHWSLPAAQRVNCRCTCVGAIVA